MGFFDEIVSAFSSIKQPIDDVVGNLEAVKEEVTAPLQDAADQATSVGEELKTNVEEQVTSVGDTLKGKQ